MKMLQSSGLSSSGSRTELGESQVTPTAEPHPVTQYSFGNTSVENSDATPVVSAPVPSAPTSIKPCTPNNNNYS